MSIDGHSLELFGFNELIAPLTMCEFFATYWEMHPCLLSLRPPTYYSALLSIDSVPLPIALPTESPSVRAYVINSHKPRTPSPDFYRSFLDGDTIIVTCIDRTSTSVNHLCKCMESTFHFIVTADLILAPPRSQAMRVRYNTDNVFILQISGKKTWNIWRPSYEVPLSDYNRIPFSKWREPDQLEILTPGDALYIPRGFVQQAYTQDESSYYLVLRVKVLTWSDIIVAAAKKVAEQHVELRRGLPVGFFNRSLVGEGYAAHFRELLHTVAQEATLEDAQRELSKSLLREQEPSLTNRFKDLDQLDHLDTTTHVKKRLGIIAFVEPEGRYLHLRFSDKNLLFPRESQAALEFVLENELFAVSEIPGFDDCSGILLVRLLIKEGLLSVHDEGKEEGIYA